MADSSTLTVPEIDSPDVRNETSRLLSTAILWHLVSAATEGARRCFLEPTSATSLTAPAADSSTASPEVSEEFRADLQRLVKAAREQPIEDGMSNPVTKRLQTILARHRSAMVPALVGVLESRQTPPIVAAELLKELGRIRDRVSHPHRLWVLAYALRAASPLTRDGAGLGLARLGDRDALTYLRAAIQREPLDEIREDLRLVADELAALDDDGVPGSRDL